MPQLKQPFFGVPDGEIYPKQFRAGQDVTGDLAEQAAVAGALEVPKKKKPAPAAPETAAASAPETAAAGGSATE